MQTLANNVLIYPKKRLLVPQRIRNLLVNAAIETKEERDIMTLNIPNQIAPDVYYDYVIYQNHKKILYVSMLKMYIIC